MHLFKFPRRDKKHADAESFRQFALRLVILAILFGAVVWGFWMNAERQQNLIRGKPPAGTSWERSHAP
jgi:hypothetical protein